MLREMFKKTYTKIDSRIKNAVEEKAVEEPNIPEGLWKKCNKCGQPIYVEDVRNNYYICPKCDGYFRIHAKRRIEMITDKDTFVEWDQEMEISNPLDFPGYEKKLEAAKEKSHLDEAIVTGKAYIGGYPAVLGVCDARFLMSSMGHNVGEKIARAVERATAEKLPVILFACSGGARMQEGIVSLMQMAKTSAALQKHHDAGQLFVSVLTDPTTGGVTASFAMLGDIILAEPNALIGFAGPRVIAQTIGQKLPEGFQRSEFLLEHGFIDQIVERKDQRDVLTKILRVHAADRVTSERYKKVQVKPNADYLYAAAPAQDAYDDGYGDEESESGQDDGVNVDNDGISQRNSGKSAWDTVQLSRSADRPVASDYINAIFDDFIEFHGDRYYGDDGAIIGGVAMFGDMPVTVIGQQKGKTTKENIKRNFGMPSPEGYRKALRLMKQAETFHRPIICFVDTPGAYCGIEAEERGQGEAIARNLFEMAALTVPTLSIVIGEGGSGGALAMAVGNEVWMLENAIYSILSPEGFATILWKDSKMAPEAARVMKITAKDLLERKLIERVIPERMPACEESVVELSAYMKSYMREFFAEYHGMTGEQIAEARYKRFRDM